MSETTEKRKRKPNYSDEEMIRMIKAVHDRKSLLAKFNRNITAKSKQLQWLEVTEEVET